MTIRGLHDKVKVLDTDRIAEESLEQTKEAFADKNAIQMYSGQRSDDTEILPTYSDLTIEIKQSKGQPSDRVTLRDTGSFYQGIRTTISGEVIRIDSSDEKSEKLKKKYGEKIFGLGGEYKEAYLDEDLRPVWKEKIEDATGLIMQ